MLRELRERRKLRKQTQQRVPKEKVYKYVGTCDCGKHIVWESAIDLGNKVTYRCSCDAFPTLTKAN